MIDILIHYISGVVLILVIVMFLLMAVEGITHKSITSWSSLWERLGFGDPYENNQKHLQEDNKH
jgi:hypothetical protein